MCLCARASMHLLLPGTGGRVRAGVGVGMGRMGLGACMWVHGRMGVAVCLRVPLAHRCAYVILSN